MFENEQNLFTSVPLEERKKHLCEALYRIHGPGYRRKEKSGEHVYIPCPNCLARDGDKEFYSRHLAINLDRLFDPFRPGGKKSGVALCMKESKPWSMSDLLAMSPIEDRGFHASRPKIVQAANSERYLVPDGKGNMVPDGPGRTIRLNMLGEDHPAVIYVKSRNFDPDLLVRQFDASFCTHEAPEGEEFGNRYWRKHAAGWKSTPQGRIIFFARCGGMTAGWQARFLEMTEDLGGGESRKWLWHPYTAAWEPEPEWDHRGSPVKYLTAPGSLRNSMLPAFDHVSQMATLSGAQVPVLTEGPLDAARFPDLGIPLFGKSLSELQALLLASKFRYAVLGFDTDVAGRTACEKASETLSRHGVRTVKFFEDGEGAGGKTDIGGMTYEEALARYQSVISRLI